ncbi:MAG: hypothetical protein U1F43_17660 [Myxococcota bacterium]
MPLPPRLALAAFAVFALAGGCGDDHPSTADAPDTSGDASGDATPDAADAGLDAADAAPDATGDAADDTDATPDVAPDTTADANGDTADTTPTPHRCGDLEACNAFLDDDGLCPDTCFTTVVPVACPGSVRHAVCDLGPAPPPQPGTVDYGALRVTPTSVPQDAVVGDARDLVIRLENTSDAPLSRPFGWKDPHTWLITAPSWAGLSTIDLAPHATLDLTARITAQRATTLSQGGDLVVTFDFGGDVYEPRATVHFPDTTAFGGFSCGGEHFPQTWCSPDNGDDCAAGGNFYLSARCCDDVFYPGAVCCDDDECQDGSCVSGRCVYAAPLLGSANNAAVGHQTIRLVLVDAHPEITDPCADHAADLAAELQLDRIEGWFDDLARRRLGRDAMDLRWTVSAVATSDFLSGENQWEPYVAALDAYLTAQGCPLRGAYDKIIVSGPSADLMGYGGIYFDRGEIAAGLSGNPYLFTHELAHSFGATDLYLDLAGRLVFPLALMGDWLQPDPFPSDAVAWAELGFGDVDHDGVIDAVEQAAFPTSLDVADLRATLTTKDTLEIRWRFVGIEDGIAKRVQVPIIASVAIPAAGFALGDWSYQLPEKVLVLAPSQVDFAAVEAAGTLDVALRASYRFTDRDWQHRTLTLDRTFAVPVTRQ